ncbi:hypothetical protein [Demequina aurantiaca]|uniref:hypothetical protein n=1 Tax=Demequina aurantiaca TaxID=676200 RepID=UPI003D359725
MAVAGSRSSGRCDMGIKLEVGPSPVDERWPGVSVVVPPLPSQVEWLRPSGETLLALERASRALGRIDGAYRAARAPEASIYATLALEALASVAVHGEAASWSKLRYALAAAPVAGSLQTSHDRTARHLQKAIGLTGSTGRGGDPAWVHTFEAALTWWPSAMRKGRMPERFASDLISDLCSWVNDGKQPALVKASIAMMVAAATDPDCPDTAIVARELFAVVLEGAGGIDRWCAPAISAWFAHDRGSWSLVATALAGEGEPDPVAVDTGLRAVFDAVTRSANSGAFGVEWASKDAVRLIESAPVKLTRKQQVLVEVLVGTPALSPLYVPALLGVTERGARRIIKTVLDSGLAVERLNPRGDPYLMAPHGMRAWLTAVAAYQVPGMPDTEV